jgi:hypothetical protein
MVADSSAPFGCSEIVADLFCKPRLDGGAERAKKAVGKLGYKHVRKTAKQHVTTACQRFLCPKGAISRVEF